MTTNNPVLKNKTIVHSKSSKATKSGIFLKTLLGLGVMVITMIMTLSSPLLYAIGNSIIAMFVFIAVMFWVVSKVSKSPKMAKRLFFGYAIIEGMFIASFIAWASMYVPGLPLFAAVITILFFVMMQILYGINKDFVLKIKPVLMFSMFFILIVYMANLVFALFGNSFFDYSSPLYLGFTIFVVIIAALSLLLDFRDIDDMLESEVGKEYEYLGAFALLTTIVWLYISIIRLGLALASND
jgi:uncharacterized YccA/Bax inhibitor family protein